MTKEELLIFLKENLRVTADRRDGYVSMGGPQDGDSEPGDIHIELWLGDEKISSTSVGNW